MLFVHNFQITRSNDKKKTLYMNHIFYNHSLFQHFSRAILSANINASNFYWREAPK
jgi:hypothetical protein